MVIRSHIPIRQIERTMIIKKLAAPLINDKLLLQAEHCYIATAAISEAGFDFVRSRIPTKCKMEIVTGLDVPTSPEVLRRIWRNYQDRITLNIYTRTIFRANVYMFDLPYRKAVAFVGSGNFTLEGIKDHEELFYKITDPKEIETLKSWFTGYYEFSEPLTEAIIQEYEWIFPTLRQREIASRQEKKEFIELTASGFNWDAIKFKNQYFQKDDYLTFGSNKAQLNTSVLIAERESVKAKLLQVHELIKKKIAALQLCAHEDSNQIVSSHDPIDHPDNKLRAIWIEYGRGEAELKSYNPKARLADFMNLQIRIKHKEFEVLLLVGRQNGSKTDRENFKLQMNVIEYRNQFFKLLTALGAGYWIEIVGDKRKVETFLSDDALWEFTKADHWMYYAFAIGRSYPPGDSDISTENIASTILKEFEKLIFLYRHVTEHPTRK